MKRLHLMLLVAFGIAFAGVQWHAQAQEKFPSKPVKILVPYGPGGATDIGPRIVGDRLTPVIFPAKFKINYNKDVIPLMRLVDIPAFLLVTTTNFSVNSVPELIANIKKNPGRARYGTVGVGSYPPYDMALFAKRAGGLDMIGIPNRNGAAGVIIDMATGDTQTAFLNVASTAGMLKAGKIKALAVVNPVRLPEYPDIPPRREGGV